MDTIQGQDKAVDMLQTQFKLGRLHHAYIFHGPAGVGKMTTALAFARELLASEPPEHPEHPDLHVVTKELARYSDDASTRSRKLTSIPVAVLRSALLEPVYRAASVPGGRKVFIVDEAELLNATGQNLLLKTLEEPPEGTIVILVTSSDDRLLPTIRSRCQRVPFVTLNDQIVSHWLNVNAADLSPENRDALLTFAQGSIGRAAMALEYDLIEWTQRVLTSLEGMTRGRQDGHLGGDIAEMIDTFAKTWVEAHDNASKEAANQLGATLMGSMIASHAARRLKDAAEQCDPNDVDQSDAVTLPWIGVIEAVQKSQRLLGSNVNLGLVCDQLASQMAGSLQPTG